MAYRSDKQFMKNPATAACRIYVGSIADPVTAADLEERFKPHGKILGLVLQRGFGFIQFENEAQAQTAIRQEHNQMFHGRKLNVKQALDKGRTGPQNNASGPEKPFEKPSGGPSLMQQGIGGPKQLHLSEPQNEMMDTDVLHEDLPEEQLELENDPFASSDVEDDGDDRRQRNRHGGGGGGRPMKGRDRWDRDEFVPRDMPIHRDGPFRGRDRNEGPLREGPFREGPLREVPFREGPFREGPHREGPHREGLIREGPHREGLLRDGPHREGPLREGLLREGPLRDRPDMLLRDRGDVLHRDRGDGPPFFGREDQFRDRPPPVFIPPPVIDRPERNDCEIIVVSKALTEYAEFIEQKLKGMGLVVDLLFPNEDVPIGRVLANISSRGCLFSILVMPQNEEFRSLTLNILHGIPQEHRNMPVEDALILIGRNFDSYMRGEKPGAIIPGSVVATLSERHPEQIQIMFNLLAENRQLTSAQYDRVLKYLQERRELQSQYEIAESGAELTAEGEPNTKQVELQNRIMNILNKSADEPPKPAEIPTPVQPPAGATPLLNDPSVQKALDSLLSGDMFKSMTAGGF